jgi:hypothetical protein
VVIRYFDFMGIPALPHKTDTPLIIDSDTELPFTVAFKSLQPVGGRDSQIVKVLGVIYHP